PVSAVCNGDSGSGLVTDGTHTIIGIASAGQPGCVVGSHVIFTAVGAPEIIRFIQGDEHPPIAPRRTDATYVRLFWDGPLRAGNTVGCDSGGWESSSVPQITYAFVRSDTGDVLQQGPKDSFTLTARQVGTSIFCRVLATNEG